MVRVGKDRNMRSRKESNCRELVIRQLSIYMYVYNNVLVTVNWEYLKKKG